MEAINEMISCDYCKETYNRFNHIPYQLTCQHSVCRHYLQEKLEIDCSYFDKEEEEIIGHDETKIEIKCLVCGKSDTYGGVSWL